MEEGSVVAVRRQRVVAVVGFAATLTRTLQFLEMVLDGVETDSGVHPGVGQQKRFYVEGCVLGEFLLKEEERAFT